MPAFEPTWTSERIELLRTHFEAGLTCREIADQIGVTRNAVIGKLSRLNLNRDKVPAPAPRRVARQPRRRAVSRLRRQILKSVAGGTVPSEEAPIHNGHCCSLLELTKRTCRWPISTPGAPDFRFCGNAPIEGLPYCAGHSRLAYRLTSR